MRKIGQLTENIYCAFCKIPRRVFVKKHIGLFNIMASVLASLPIMYAIWGEYDSRFIMIATVFLCFSEIFVHIRWRLSVKCPHCAFDPILYSKNRAQLVENINKRLEQHRQSPLSLLSTKNPLHTLAKRPLSDTSYDGKPVNLVSNETQVKEYGSERESVGDNTNL